MIASIVTGTCFSLSMVCAYLQLVDFTLNCNTLKLTICYHFLIIKRLLTNKILLFPSLQCKPHVRVLGLQYFEVDDLLPVIDYEQVMHAKAKL